MQEQESEEETASLRWLGITGAHKLLHKGVNTY